MPKVLALLLFAQLFSFTICIAQSQVIFTPAPDDAPLLKALAIKYEDHYKTELTLLPKENKKDFEEVYKQRWDNVKSVFDKKEIYTSATAQQYLDAMVAEIVKANPLLQKQNFNCYF